MRLNNKSINLLHLINGILTFSYAVLYSTLALFLSENLGYSKAQANSYVGIFLAYNFILHLVAGYLGGRYLSNRSLLFISSIFQIIGTYLLCISTEANLTYALSLVILGCGINTTSLKCILTQQFESDDNRREVAFFINYSVMNMGFLLGFFAAGYYDIHSSYMQLFYLCNIFNVLAVLFVMLGWKQYKEKQLIFSKYSFLRVAFIIVFFIGLFSCVYLGFKYFSVANVLIAIFGFLAFIYLIFQIKLTKTHKEKVDIFVFLILLMSSIIFWTLFYIGPMGLTYFLKNNVATYLGLSIPPQWYMNLNSIFVITGSPVFAIVLQKLRQKGYKVSIVRQFSYAIIFIAASYLLLSLGILNANEYGYISAIWIVLHFLLQAVGELLIAPVGYAMVGKFAPPKLQGMMMGFWMMVSGIAASLAQYLSNLNYSDSAKPLITNSSYLVTFNNLVIYAVFFGLIFLFFSKKIEKLIVQS
ncbi:TPA: peptide MFS transporter [Legionella bozemanae]|uniref:peptide MFS transporter n=1 Tax=Legionella bozemanae TaxID=447 RepID=UPI00399D50C6